MKKFLLFASISVMAIGAVAQPQGKNPVSPHDTVTSSHVKITYGRPYKKDRVIFGGLVPYDSVWRTGANEATEITFMKDGKFAGKPVKAGTYTLFTVPGPKEWTIILNSTLKQWGAYTYKKDKDILTSKVSAQKLPTALEQFTITLSETDLKLEWDKTSVTVPYRF